MTSTEYLTLLHAPVRVLDTRAPRRTRSNARDVDARAERAAALVEARTRCECADRADDERVAHIIGAYTRQLDIQHKRDVQEARIARQDARDDARISRILDGYTRYLDAEHRRAMRKAQRKSLAQRYREYLNRCAARARARYDAAWRASLARSAQPVGERLSEPGPLVRVGPATQPSQPSQPKPSRQPGLTYRMTGKLRAAWLVLEAAMPQPEQVLTAYDYTTPSRIEGGATYQLSSMEERKMDEYDMQGLDEHHRNEVDACQFGADAIIRPTHESMLAARMGGCTDYNRRATWKELCAAPSQPIVIADGKPCECERYHYATPATLCKVEVRF